MTPDEKVRLKNRTCRMWFFRATPLLIQCIRVGGTHVTDTLLIHIKRIPDTYLIQTYQERESAETLIHR